MTKTTEYRLDDDMLMPGQAEAWMIKTRDRSIGEIYKLTNGFFGFVWWHPTEIEFEESSQRAYTSRVAALKALKIRNGGE